jgi:hypothetical protein
MPTFRRLNDGTRYYGLTWRGWLALSVGGGVLYLAVRCSPLGYRPTITLTLFAITAAAMALYALSGQALGPGRYVMAIVRWWLGPARFVAPDAEHTVTGGVLVDAVPLVLVDAGEQLAWWQPDAPARQLNGNHADARSDNGGGVS